LPAEYRGSPDPMPIVESSMMKVGDIIEYNPTLSPGDIVILLLVHRERFALKRVTPSEAAEISGPKYIVPPEWGSLPLFFTVNGWEEYRAPATKTPWWQIW